MELLIILALLSRRRVLVAAGLVLSVALGAYVGGLAPAHGGTRGSTGSQALAQILVDTPVPLAATSDNTLIGADTIIKRAILLADEIGSDAVGAAIAQQSGLKPDQLAVLTPLFDPVSLSTYLPDGQLPVRAAQAARKGVHQPYVVTLVAHYGVPILSIAAASPDDAHTGALVTATIAALRSHGTGVRIKQLGPIQTASVPAGPGAHHARGAAVGFVAFFIWCVGIVVASGLLAALRSPDVQTGLQPI